MTANLAGMASELEYQRRHFDGLAGAEFSEGARAIETYGQLRDLEFALQAIDAADDAKPDLDLRDRLLARDCYRLLYELKKAAGEVPEPSPLFWNHLSARVRDAVAVEPIPRAWWMTYWRPFAL